MCRWEYAEDPRDAEIASLKKRVYDIEKKGKEAAAKLQAQVDRLKGELQVGDQEGGGGGVGGGVSKGGCMWCRGGGGAQTQRVKGKQWGRSKGEGGGQSGVNEGVVRGVEVRGRGVRGGVEVGCEWGSGCGVVGGVGCGMGVVGFRRQQQSYRHKGTAGGWAGRRGEVVGGVGCGTGV